MMEEEYDDYISRVNDQLESLAETIEPSELSEAVKHVTLSGGKRLRPILTLLASEAVNRDDDDTETADKAIRFAAGVEFVHTSALVADDVIDRSRVRRGVPTVHERYDHDMAVLSSNILLGKALETIDDKQAVRAMVDAVKKLGEGEAMELSEDLETVEDYETLAYRKTAALFVAATEVGAIAGDATEEEKKHLKNYARHLGIAFQIRDDVLDFTSSQDDLGKPVGRDAILERPSIVVIHSRNQDVRLVDSVEFARNRAQEHVDEAKNALEQLDTEGGPVEKLERITEFTVERNR
ncbi:MAG: polyprenyl synthetase family protein [Halobacteria archaeon]